MIDLGSETRTLSRGLFTLKKGEHLRNIPHLVLNAAMSDFSGYLLASVGHATEGLTTTHQKYTFDTCKVNYKVAVITVLYLVRDAFSGHQQMLFCFVFVFL